MARIFKAKKKTQVEKKHQQVTIERLDHKGAGIAFFQRKPLFIEGALPSEVVLTQLTESKSKYARGSLIKILKTAANRIEPFCPHYDECGGCNFQHLSHDEQVQHKENTLRHLMRKVVTEQTDYRPTVLSDSTEYRRRVRFSVKWNPKTRTLAFGFRKAKSNDIVEINQCDILDKTLAALIPSIKSTLGQLSDPKLIGHVELVKGDNTIGLSLRHLSALTPRDQETLNELAIEQQLSLYLIPETDRIDLSLGEPLYYDDNDAVIRFNPSHFVQVNKNINQKMVAQALEWLELTADDRVLDLFCGLGNFSAPLAKKVQQVVGVEGVEEMVVAASHNAQQNQLNNIDFYQANLETPLLSHQWAKERFSKVLLDPARAGAQGVVEQLHQLNASHIVYVSCNPTTLARDAEKLIENGYTLSRLGMLDMFPQTSHLEAMALFTKK
ncbi:23S rRNA (uracil(1939)-C(5))-methyltransferase RlmD [Vibrio sp.]|nr:23S rRNA (uracil(1939)-C(5))-methyltransferase RlmD [Vibrio sp.]